MVGKELKEELKNSHGVGLIAAQIFGLSMSVPFTSIKFCTVCVNEGHQDLPLLCLFINFSVKFPLSLYWCPESISKVMEEHIFWPMKTEISVEDDKLHIGEISLLSHSKCLSKHTKFLWSMETHSLNLSFSLITDIKFSTEIVPKYVLKQEWFFRLKQQMCAICALFEALFCLASNIQNCEFLKDKERLIWGQ